MAIKIELLRVEKKSFVRGIHVNELLALDSDGTIRKCELWRAENKKTWRTIGQTKIDSIEWLAVCRGAGYQLTNAVHQIS